VELEGVVRNGVIVPDAGSPLPEGTRVRITAEPAVERLPDDQLLALCDATLDPTQQGELSGLLARAREGGVAAGERARLDELMTAYRRGLILKARALTEAVARGLRPRLSDEAA